MKILSVASEAVPLVKTGGLADVVGALPNALAPLGVEMRVLLPAYPAVKQAMKKPKSLWQAAEFFGGPAEVLGFKIGDTEFLALDAPHLYDRAGSLYNDENGQDFGDNAERFAALSLAASCVIEEGLADGWAPDVVHVHDWQAALVPTYMKSRGRRVIPSIITIHNIAFQGVLPADKIEALQLPWDRFHPDGYEYYGQVSTLKAGLADADYITTVSPTYASELKTPEFGMGLDGMIRARQDRLVGILNGVDLDEWSPENAEHPYDARKMAGKAKNRAALLERFGLAETDGALAILVSRLTYQKGIDLLIEALPEYFSAGGALVLLGSGDPHYESQLRQLQQRYPAHFGLEIGYNEALAKAMFAGGDAVLVPSRFEPCGLTQLYGLRFGTLPLVSNTGGLADTVIHANQAAMDKKVATGLVMTRTDVGACKDSLHRLLSLYRDTKRWKTLQKNAMSQNVGWDQSAQNYFELYERAFSR